jgi:methyl-accepting chemotaxis protein
MHLSEILNLKAKDIEQNSLKLFENLNEIKRVACK